jgi:DNA (cytosine-5)-methyltransferase 1
MGTGHLRAIDLYSGAGGWSLGLKMAGIDVVASYEWWADANKTNTANTAHPAHTMNIRELSLSELPENIQVVVGSPPCTEFSFSNRGGSGDIKDGLEDIIKFLTVVDHLQPDWWVMENVPRVAAIIERELDNNCGALARFRHLGMKIVTVKMDDYGIPQRRKRCLIGNLDFTLLKSYVQGISTQTLGMVVSALEKDPVRDPLFGIEIPHDELLDHELEPFLDTEELRINEAGKITHPVYNSMPFPDPLDRTARTITATCTRVSRESVVIEQPGLPGSYRRLSVRERACLQGFPITYQFYASTCGQKFKLIGNAVPPAFSFYVAQAIQQTPAGDLRSLTDGIGAFTAPAFAPPQTPTEKYGRRFPASRRFRFAIPNLRLKSGVRFEFTNVIMPKLVRWEMRFYFGTSKDIRTIDLTEDSTLELLLRVPQEICAELGAEVDRLSNFVARADLGRMQGVWSHRNLGGTRPFDVLDRLGEAGAAITALLEQVRNEVSLRAVSDTLANQYGTEVQKLPGLAKLHRNAALIHAGMIVGVTANLALNHHFRGHTRTPSDTAPLMTRRRPTQKTAAN